MQILLWDTVVGDGFVGGDDGVVGPTEKSFRFLHKR